MFELSGVVYATLGAFMALGFTGVGSAYGTHLVGNATSTAVAEGEGEKLSQFLMLQAMPGTQGIYGIIILALILMRTGIIGGSLEDVSSQDGQVAFWAGCLMGLTGLLSAIYQGRVAATGVTVVIKRPDDTIKVLMFAGVVEFYAVLGLIGAILLIFSGIKA